MRAGITKNDRILGVLEMGGETEGRQILEFLSSTVLEYVSVKILKNGALMDKKKSSTTILGLAGLQGLQLSDNRIGQKGKLN